MNLLERLEAAPVDMLEQKSVMTLDDVVSDEDPNRVVVCDFNIDGMETAKFDEVFIRKFGDRTVLNVDHHVPVPAMMRFISSGNLAANYVRKHGVPKIEGTAVKIHHTDCDSVVSSAIMRGILPPEDKFEKAVIAADHSGAENEIGDLLQSLEGELDLPFSLQNLEYFLEGGVLDQRAQDLLENRKQERIKLKEMVQSGLFEIVDGVAYGDTDRRVDAGLLPSLIPEARAIVIGAPREGAIDKTNMKVRLTPSSPEGASLGEMKLSDGFGGRWNAGSNKRAGGTKMTSRQYAQEVAKKLSNFSNTGEY